MLAGEHSSERFTSAPAFLDASWLPFSYVTPMAAYIRIIKVTSLSFDLILYFCDAWLGGL